MNNETPFIIIGLLLGLLIGSVAAYIGMGTREKRILIRHNLMTITNDASGNRVYFYTTNWIPEK